MKKLLTATGQTDLDELVLRLSKYENLGSVEYKKDLSKIVSEQNPDILVVGENLGGKEPLAPILIKMKTDFPNIRIIYLAGNLDYKDEIKVNFLGTLVHLGVYDMVFESTISSSAIDFLLKTPQTKDFVEHLETKVKDSSYSNKKHKPIEVTFPEDMVLGENGQIIKNLYTFISPKGGVGKSFIAFNTAIDIANNGLPDPDTGKKPTVCFLDLDLSGFNVGNVYNCRKKDGNLLEISETLKSVINDSGEIICDDNKLQSAIDLIKKAGKNIHGVTVYSGDERKYKDGDSKQLTSNQISFILENLQSEYDVIIVDVNDNVEYDQVYAPLFLSRNLYMVMDMDYNSICNERNFYPYLKDLSISPKIKYILNKYIDHPSLALRASTIESELGYEFISKVPKLNDIDMLNAIYSGICIMNEEDDKFYYFKQCIGLIANDIWLTKDGHKIKARIKSMEKELIAEEESRISLENKLFADQKEILEKISEKIKGNEDKILEEDELKKKPDKKEETLKTKKSEPFDFNKILKMFSKKKTDKPLETDQGNKDDPNTNPEEENEPND